MGELEVLQVLSAGHHLPFRENEHPSEAMRATPPKHNVSFGVRHIAPATLAGEFVRGAEQPDHGPLRDRSLHPAEPAPRLLRLLQGLHSQAATLAH